MLDVLKGRDAVAVAKARGRIRELAAAHPIPESFS